MQHGICTHFKRLNRALLPRCAIGSRKHLFDDPAEARQSSNTCENLEDARLAAAVVTDEQARTIMSGSYMG
jgi:hypothetical protein